MIRSVKLGVCLLALALITACGAETPAPASGAATAAPGSSAAAPAASSGGAPVFPGAKTLDDSSPMASTVKMMQDTMKQQAAGTATFDAYVLPSGTTFDKVKEFYNTELTKSGWQSADALTGGVAANPGASVWIKGNGAETLTVTSIPDPSQIVIMMMQTKQ